eukprot:1179937-Prorocentrum_minimum.AAC.2
MFPSYVPASLPSSHLARGDDGGVGDDTRLHPRPPHLPEGGQRRLPLASPLQRGDQRRVRHRVGLQAGAPQQLLEQTLRLPPLA